MHAHARHGRRRRRGPRRAALSRAGPSSGTSSSARRRPCQGTCTGAATSRRTSRATRRDRGGARAFGPAADAYQLVATRDERRRARARGAPRDRRAPRARRSASLVNVFDPELVVVGGGFGPRRASCCSSRRGRSSAARRSPPRRSAAVVRAELGTDAGMVGAGARRARSARRLSADAARRLRDADRQPRGRHAARARASCARPTSSSARTRGGRGSCSSGTGSRRGSSAYHEHNEAARTAEVLPRLEAGERVALVSDAGLPGDQRSGRAADRGGARAGVPVTVLPGPSAVETALVASGLVGGALPVPRVPAARGPASSRRVGGARGVAMAGGRLRVAAAAPGVAALARRAFSRAGAAAVCRELTKQFEEVVRGSVGGARASGSPSRRRARSRSCSGRRRRRVEVGDEAARRPWPSSSRPGRRAGGRRPRRASHRRVQERALPRTLCDKSVN